MHWPLSFHTRQHEPHYLHGCIFLSLLITGVALEYVVHFLLGISIVYSHFFYLLLVIAGLWFHKRAVYLAIIFAILHIVVQFRIVGAVTPDTIIRGIMFITVAYVVGMMAGRLKERNTDLELANTKLAESEQAFQIANRKLNLLSSITRHDILNQVTSLFGYLTLAKEENDASQRDVFLQKAEGCVEFIKHQIAFTREYQDVGVHAPQWQSLKRSIESCVKFISERNITIETPAEDYEVLADPLLPRIFANLIDNSIRHGEKVTRIVFSAAPAGPDLIVRCDDDGIGIPTNEKEKIFEAGFGKNTGFGLFLTREILSITGIEIREEGVPGKGASFVIVVPAGKFHTFHTAGETTGEESG